MRRILSCITLSLALAGTATCAAQALPFPAAAQGKPGAVAVAPGAITYFAQGGDTLMSIAQTYTGRRENWLALGRINRIDRDASIPIGTGIVIPADLLIDESAEATVATMSGSSRATAADGTAVTLSIGMRVGEGVEIETGANSFLTLSLVDASRVSVPSNSRVRLAKLRVTRYTGSPRTEVMLLRGRIESRVAPLEAVKGKFEVRTPQSVAGVRGTRFRVGIVGTGVAHEVLSGSVAAGSRKQADTLTLAAGHGAIVGATNSGTAVDLLPPPQMISPETAAVYSAARFTVAPQPGASAYHIQISTDQEALNVIAESRSAQPELAVDGLRDGQYFMHVSALDRAGLEGLVRTQAFTLKQHASPMASSRVPAPSIERSDARSVTLRWAAQPGLRYQLQIARDADFSWLIHSAATELPEASVPRPPFGTYYARVQLLTPDGRLHASSSVQPFVVTDHWVLNDGTPFKAREPMRNAAGNVN